MKRIRRISRFLSNAFVWLFIACSLPYLSFAAPDLPQYSQRLWQAEDGLPHNVVRAVAQSTDGHLWVGTLDGLVRFDGLRFHEADFPELRKGTISALCPAQDGSLWVGTDHGLFRILHEKISHYTRAEGLSGDAVRALQEDKDGALWIASAQGVARLKDEKITQPFAEHLKNDPLWDFSLDPNGSAWIASSRLKHIEGSSLQSLTSTNGLIPGGLRALHFGTDGTLWIGTTMGLSRWKNGTFTNYPKGNGASAIVSSILQDRAGNVWIGTYAGLSRLVNGTFINEFQENDTAYWIYSIMEDREGSIWIGSEEGLTRLTPRLFTTYTRQQGLLNNTIRSVCAAQDGSIWIGAWGGGLNRWKDGQVTAYKTTSGLASEFILALYESRDSSIWIGMDYGGGINRLKDGRMIHYGKPEGLLESVVTAFLEDRQGSLWIGTVTALVRFQNEKFVRFRTGDGLSNNRINALCERANGELWIGTDGGLSIWNGRFINHSTFSEASVLSLHEDKDQTLWVGTRTHGLQRLHQDQITAYTTLQGLPSDTIYSMLSDEQGHLWINSGRGIFRVHKHDLEQVTRGQRTTVDAFRYGKTDGIISGGDHRSASQPGACQGADSRLWFRTTQGVAVVNPANLGTNHLAPPVVIEKIVVDKKIVQKIPGSNSTGLRFSPGRGEFEFHYAALSLTAPEKNQYRYKLEGWDNDWIEAGTRREAFYNNVPPGTYVFQISASNNDGVWNQAGASVKFTLQPHLWQTWWFKTFALLISLSCVVLIVRYATKRRLDLKLQQLEQQSALEKERARIAQDMHDDLGVRLTEILFMSNLLGTCPPENVKGHARRIESAGRELVQNLDAIVWAVNPRNDSVKRLSLYIGEFAGKFLAVTGIQCRLDIPSDLPEHPISSEIRHNLFLVAKESLNNIAKHSGASEVRLQLRFTESLLTLSIEDNGHGFSESASSLLGNGLANMKQRMEKIGGDFELYSQPGEGTRIQLSILII